MKVPARFTKMLAEARALLAAGKPKKALEIAQRAFALVSGHLPAGHPSLLEVERLLGELLLELGHAERAAMFLRDAGELPDPPELVERVKQLNREMLERLRSEPGGEGLVQAALTVLSEATTLSSQSPAATEAMLNLARVHEKNGQFGDAEELSQQVLATRRQVGAGPEQLVPAILVMARVQLVQGRFGRVESLAREALRLLDDSASWERAQAQHWLARACHELGRPDEALRCIEAALLVNQQAGDLDDSEHALKLQLKASLQARLGQGELALETSDRAYLEARRLLGESDLLTIRLRFEHGLLLSFGERFVEAMSVLQHAYGLAEMASTERDSEELAELMESIRTSMESLRVLLS